MGLCLDQLIPRSFDDIVTGLNTAPCPRCDTASLELLTFRSPMVCASCDGSWLSALWCSQCRYSFCTDCILNDKYRPSESSFGDAFLDAVDTGDIVYEQFGKAGDMAHGGASFTCLIMNKRRALWSARRSGARGEPASLLTAASRALRG